MSYELFTRFVLPCAAAAAGVEAVSVYALLLFVGLSGLWGVSICPPLEGLGAPTVQTIDFISHSSRRRL